jgi:hypothetical protein
MPPVAARGRITLLVMALGWVGYVFWRYQRIDSAEPLAAIVLVVTWLVVFSLASYGGGILVWRLVAATGAPPLRALPVVAAAGAGVLIAGAAALSLVGALRPIPLSALLLACAGYGTWCVREVSLGCARWPPRAVLMPFMLVGVIALYTVLVVATASPFYDQLHYHLAFPFHWLRAGHVVTFERHAYSFFPANMGLLYAYALATFGVGAAQALHWWMAALTVGGVATIAGVVAGARAGWWGAVLLAACPSVMLTSTWAAADLGVTAFASAAWLLVLLAHRGDPGRRIPWWLLAGVFVGLAIGCKYLAAVTVGAPVLLGVVLCPAPRRPRARVSRVLLLVAGAGLALAPWLMRNLLATSNPVYPFLSKLFARSPVATTAVDAAAVDRIAKVSTTLPDLAAVVTLGTFNPEGDGGAIGPTLLALLPLGVVGALERRRRFGPVLAAGAVAAVAGWAMGPLMGRYLLPALVPLAAVEAVGWQRLRARLSRPLRHAFTVVVTTGVLWGASGGTSPAELARLTATLGQGSGDDLMRRFVSYWPAVPIVNSQLPIWAELLLVGESRTMYIDREVVVEDPFRTPLLVELAAVATTGKEIAAALRARGVTHLLVNHQEMRRIAALNGREAYFAPLDQPEWSRLVGFFRRCTRRVAVSGPVEVFELVGTEGR